MGNLTSCRGHEEDVVVQPERARWGRVVWLGDLLYICGASDSPNHVLGDAAVPGDGQLWMTVLLAHDPQVCRYR